MGIYANVNQHFSSDRVMLIEETAYPGIRTIRTYRLVDVVEHRDDCFCCSCGDFSTDPYCRNHGWAGSRPCDIHGMPGQLTEEGEMPDPVTVGRSNNG